MKILVVEDDQMIREGVCEYLSESGYEMVEAGDGREALARFYSDDIDLVILDIQIPHINGLDVLKEIRRKSRLPVLILTAFSDEEYKIEAFTSLADGYIEKPFSLPVLKARIDSLIERHFGLTDEGCALTRAQILDGVWKETEEIPFDRVIDVYIKELRKKLGLDCIITVRNVGYKLERQ